ncbi:translation initiation factor IF-2 N-terminal domain-containing protein [Williamsia sterculiae]|uniref:Ribonuclease E n=1 Tax=Williamsia sterculiae TaxID=1344003 RepID=A0A1N7GJI3_9NOCA|nr:translation initiation factor IF-2 N-terminal domain-containing protein [Williamsia sterculiae]SIS12771.1 ribonuclease E [Williamsia sterculiae]
MTDNRSPEELNTDSASAHEFPHKLRVHALARLLGLTSREVLGHLAELGITARSPQSSIDRAAAVQVQTRIAGETTEPASEPPVDTASSADTAPPADTETLPAAVPATETSSPATETADTPTAAESAPTLFSAATVGTEPAVEPERRPEPAAAGNPLFLPPPDRSEVESAPTKRKAQKATAAQTENTQTENTQTENTQTENTRTGNAPDEQSDDTDSDDDTAGGGSRKRRRGRRGRGRGRGDQNSGDQTGDDQSPARDDDTSPTADRDDADETGDEQQDQTGDDTAGGRPGGKRTRNRKRSGAADNGDTKDAAADGRDATEGSPDAAGKGRDSTTTATKGSGPKSPDPKDSDTKGSDDTDSGDQNGKTQNEGSSSSDDDSDDSGAGSRRRRRRRRRKGGGDGDTDDAKSDAGDDPPNTVVHEREPRNKSRGNRDEVQGISGSTRLEAKRQRRRDGRDAGRRRPPILTESEFLARREAVDRVMVVRERSANAQVTEGDSDVDTVEDYTQIAVLEDGVLVEHFVTTSTSSSMVGNIYLGRVQNVLPGMEAAFVDIGRGRNGVLYAGEVNWDAAGLDGGSRKIEQALKPGDQVLVQVSKDPVGHKGARLTTQISLAGRFLVYVPSGSSTGISRKLPDVERKRLKQILQKIVPSEAGVIIRTASEGVSEEDLAADVARLQEQWKGIEAAAEAKSNGNGPKALYEEPDLLVKVVRDLFNEDFKQLIVEGDGAWDLVHGYVEGVASELMGRVERFTKPHADSPDVFAVHRIDEQLAKALERKVWLPSGGTLIIEHTEAMTVVDVNTGKFTGSGGNLEETVTRNNLEAAEEIVRQMRLRDIGGMIVVDFIDMVLESNRDLVLRRLTEALARDRTRHQVSEVTSLGLVQMTRKRLGTGLLEAFSSVCTCCSGRGIVVHANPVEVGTPDDSSNGGGGSKRSRRNRKSKSEQPEQQKPTHNPSEHPLFRAMAANGDGDKDHGAKNDGAKNDGAKNDGDNGKVTNGSDADQEGAADATDSEVTRADEPRVEGRRPESERIAETAEIEAVAGEAVEAADRYNRELDDHPAEPVPGDTADTGAAPDAAAATDTGTAAGTAVRPRRRRAVRRPSAPTTAAEPVTVVTAAHTESTGTPSDDPVTAAGPVQPSSTAQPVVSVRRTARRRAAGRPAGPPADD